MENSYNFFSNSAKTVEFESQQNTNPLKSKLKKSMKHFSKINTNLYYQKNNSATNIFFNKGSNTSLAKNSFEIKNMYNRLTPSCLRKNKKYGNFYIFGKREIAFNKNMKEGRRVFKYYQSIGIEKKPKNIKINKTVNSLYLTESMAKSTKNKTTLPFIEKDKSLLFEEDKSSTLIQNKNRNKSKSFSRNSLINKSNLGNSLTNKEEEIYNNIFNINSNINSTKNKNKDKKGVIYLKKISMKKAKEKENLEKREFINNSLLLKKQEILNKSTLGNKSLNEYISDFRAILSDKYMLNIKNEKVEVINENLSNKIGKVEDKIKDLEANSKLFKDEFYPKFNEYSKFFLKQREFERQRNLAFINKIYLLEKRIQTIKNMITKFQTEKDYLRRQMLLRVGILEKKLNLPKYYTDILINELSFEEIKEKYGIEIDQKEYYRILNYKNFLDSYEMDSLFEKLNMFTNENIELINAYNKIQENNLMLKKKKKKVENEINDDAQKEIDHLIIQKEKQLNDLIIKNKNLEKHLSALKSKSIGQNDNMKLTSSKLYIKVESMLKYLNDNLYYEISIEDKIKGRVTEEKLILQIIRRIEMIVTMFLAQYAEEKLQYPKKIKYFKNMFDKEKKIQKTLEQKRNNFLKIEQERKKIFERYNKLIFLQNRKIYFKKPSKKISFDEDLSKLEEKGDKIEEFLYD